MGLVEFSNDMLRLAPQNIDSEDGQADAERMVRRCRLNTSG